MTSEERKEMYRCRYCRQLVGCSEQGVIGMYSLKMLRMHEMNCADNISAEFIKR